MRRINFVPHEHLTKSHRNGWRFVCQHLAELHTSFGTTFFSWADKALKEREIGSRKWSGFLHNPVSYPNKEYPQKYQGKVYSLSQLVELDWFHNDIKTCAGLFVLSTHARDFLRQHINCPVVHLWHPSPTYDQNHTHELPQVLHIGQWMRKYHSFLDLKLPHHKKLMITSDEYATDYQEMLQYSQGTGTKTIYLSHQTDVEYDTLLTSSIVFLDLYDVSACNTIIECIMMNTPLVINRLPAASEYLGENYPLFYDTLDQAEKIIQTPEQIRNGRLYLQSMDKRRFGIQQFMHDLLSSPVYRKLPVMKL